MTATETAEAFFDAIERRAWAEAAALVEPTHADRFQKEQIGHIIAWLHFQELLEGPGPHPGGFGSSGEFDPEDLKRRATTPVPGYADAVTLGAIANLSPQEFLARRFEAGRFFPRYRKGPDGALVRVPIRVLGEASYGPDTAYVVYVHDHGPDGEAAPSARDVPYAETLPLFRRAGRWYLGLNVDLKQAGPELPLDLRETP